MPPKLRLDPDEGTWLSGVGPYWAQQNAEFEATQPDMEQRIKRQLNPFTSLGSNLGQLHTAVSEGRPMDAAVAAVSAIPAFAAMKTVAVPAYGALKAAVQQVPSWGRTALGVGAGATASAAWDEANAEEPTPTPRPRLR